MSKETDEAVERLTAESRRLFTEYSRGGGSPQTLTTQRDIDVLLTERTRHIAALERIVAIKESNPPAYNAEGRLARSGDIARAALNPTGEKQ